MKISLFLIFSIGILTQSALAIVDADSDGMSDIWEAAHGLSTTGSSLPGQSPSADPDADGFSNLLESVAGTDPFSSAPSNGIYRIRATPSAANPLALDLRWPQFIGKKYQLQSSTDLTPSSWTSMGTPFISTGTATVITTPPSSVATPRKFFRATVTDIDTDSDGLSNSEENSLNTDPNNPDTDGDGTPDKTELTQGSSPTDPADGGHVPTPPPLLPIKLKIFTYASLDFDYGKRWPEWPTHSIHSENFRAKRDQWSRDSRLHIRPIWRKCIFINGV
ncbi:MAG: hypothetical protein HC845_13265, partial [Akkermansiaceae bacterium]|nr:hypothetical protein [Akkermansiaceae bacterium]